MKVKEETKRRRFLKLIKKFRELPEERFNLEHWVTRTPECNMSSPKFLLEHPCGTAGCLAGWTVAWFPGHWQYSVGTIPILKTSEKYRNVDFYMAEYFGGTRDDWASIIYPLQYPFSGGGVPKHLVMERLLELYGRLYYGKARFRRLIKKLTELPDERFSIMSWVNTGCEHDRQIPSDCLIKNRNSTGDVAGWVVAWWPKLWSYHFGQPRLNTSDARSCPELDLSRFFGGNSWDWFKIVSISEYESYKPSKEEALKKVVALYKRLYP